MAEDRDQELRYLRDKVKRQTQYLAQASRQREELCKQNSDLKNLIIQLKMELHDIHG